MNPMIWVFVVVSILYQAVNGNDKQHLMEKLFKNYNKDIDPGNVDVQFGLYYLCASLDTETGKLQSDVWERFMWTDSRLVWNPTEFNNVSLLRIPSSLLWLPDIMVYNGQLTNMERASVNLIVYSTGHVLWIPPTEYRTSCYPKDGLTTWQCNIKAGSWTYDGFAMNLTKADSPLDLSHYNSRCAWTVSKVNKVTVEDKFYSCCPEPYPLFEADFELTRT